MTIYGESVELASTRERILNALLLVFVLAVLWLAARAWREYGEFFDITTLVVQAVFGLLVVVHNSLATYLQIHLSKERLSLRVGLLRTRIPLSTVVEAKSFPEGRRERRRVWLELLALSLVSGEVKSQIELHIFGGKLIHFSTQQPEYLAELINRQAKRAFRDETFKLVEKHKQRQSRGSQ